VASHVEIDPGKRVTVKDLARDLVEVSAQHKPPDTPDIAMTVLQPAQQYYNLTKEDSTGEDLVRDSVEVSVQYEPRYIKPPDVVYYNKVCPAPKISKAQVGFAAA
jgi:hypothetical protein